MDRETFGRAVELFADAVELGPNEREAFLERACAGDAALLEEVRSLLRAATDSDDYFRDLSDRLGVASSLDDGLPAGARRDRPRTGRSGLVVGSYTLTEPIGSGGSGTVWRAERSDGRFEGHVAIKLVTPAAATSAPIGRLGDEARHLAKLSHPNIARLLDAGVDEDDHPYLVLEYVDGTSIDRYCDAKRLSIRQRIRLFMPVLHAVAHAHAHLIVHRDIKPSNVLVDAKGHVKLLDFGIARLLRPEAAPSDHGATIELGAALTPEYAAPEQLVGKEVTTATDVYSLGLMLYELLTGSDPRSTDTLTSYAALVEAATRDPPKASTRASRAEHRGTSIESLRRALRGDLDNILGKSLMPEPADRYRTVADFAADLERYLNNEPVVAMKPTVPYRLQKFVRRHRGGVAGAVLTAMALIGAAVVTTWQMLEAQKQRDAAIYQQQRAQATNEFLNFLIEEIGPGGEPMTLLELTDRGVAMLEQQYGTEPRFVGRVLYELATPYFTLGKLDRLGDLLEKAESAARTNYDPDLLAAILCLQSRATLQTSGSGAGDLLSEALQLLSQRRVPSINAIASCSRAEALMLVVAGDRPAAASLLESTLVRLRADPAASIRDEIFVMNELSSLYFDMRDFSRTLELNDQILRRMEETGRGRSLGYMVVSMNGASLLQALGEIKVAHDARLELLTRLENLGRSEQLPPRFMASYADSLLRLARYDEALAVFRDRRDAAADAGDERSAAQLDLQIGRALLLSGRFDEAELHLDRGGEFLARQPGINDRLIGGLDMARAQLLLGRGDQDAAIALIDATLEEKGYPEDLSDPSIMNFLRVGARVAMRTGDAPRAETFATDFHQLASARARDPVLSADVGEALLLRAQARLELGDESGAADDLARAIPCLVNGLGDDHPDTVEARALLEGLND